MQFRAGCNFHLGFIYRTLGNDGKMVANLLEKGYSFPIILLGGTLSMHRKSLIILALLLAIILMPLSAVKYVPSTASWLGFSIGTEWDNHRFMLGENHVDFNDYLMSYAMEGATYLNDDRNFGVGYSLGMKKLFAEYIDGDKVSSSYVEDYVLAFSMDVLCAWRHFFSDRLALETGLGMAFDMAKYSGVGSENFRYFSLEGKAALSYSFNEFWSLRAGLGLRIPVWCYYTYSGSPVINERKPGVIGLAITPSVSAVINF